MRRLSLRSGSRLVAAAGVALMLAAVATRAAARPPGGGFDMLSMLETRVGGISLDESTRNAVYAIIDGAKSSRREMQARLRQEHAALREALDRDNPDQTTVLAQAERVGEVTTELRKQELTTLLAVRAQLTPEQRQQLRPSHDGHAERDGSHGPGCWHRR